MNSSRKRQATPDTRLAELAVRQHNVVTINELRALNLKDGAIEYRLRVGRLHRQHQGVYSVGTPALTLQGRFLAAVRAIGDGATLSHRAAAAYWSLRPLGHDEQGEIDVSVTRSLRQREGIRLHVVRFDPGDATRRDGILVTTVARTLVDLAGVLPPQELRRAVNEALVQRRVTIAMLRRYIDAARGRRAARALRTLLARAAPTRSELEDRMLAFLHRHGVPRPITNVTPPGIAFEVDFFFPDLELVIETDGGQYHENPLAKQADAEKQAILEAAGLRVLRVRWDQIHGTGEELTARRIRRAVTEQQILCALHKDAARPPRTLPVREPGQRR